MIFRSIALVFARGHGSSSGDHFPTPVVDAPLSYSADETSTFLRGPTLPSSHQKCPCNKMVGTPSNDASTAVESPTSPQPKRRKIRKGTQSCWECKRRKIRCTFAAPGESVCDGCRSRSTNCVSQEFDDETESTGRVGVVRGGAPSVEVAPEGRTSGLGNADSEVSINGNQFVYVRV